MTTIFVNSRGEKGRVSKKMQNFLDLMNDKVVDGDNYIKQLKDKMLMYSNDSGWRRTNMDLKMKMDDARYIGRKEGERLDQRKSTLSAIQKVMSALKVTADQAMDILHIPESDRAFYKARLEEATVQEQSGEFNSRMDSVPKMMDAFHISLDQALALLQLSESERDFYQKHLPK